MSWVQPSTRSSTKQILFMFSTTLFPSGPPPNSFLKFLNFPLLQVGEIEADLVCVQCCGWKSCGELHLTFLVYISSPPNTKTQERQTAFDFVQSINKTTFLTPGS